MTITLAPGYVLSRSKEKINVTITDDFFKEGSTTKVSSLIQSIHVQIIYISNIFLCAIIILFKLCCF